MAAVNPPHSEPSGTPVGDRARPELGGSYRRVVVAIRTPRCGPNGESDPSVGRRMVAQDGQNRFGRAKRAPHQCERLNRGHRWLGTRRWDELIHRVVDEMRGQVPWRDEAAKSESWR